MSCKYTKYPKSGTQKCPKWIQLSKRKDSAEHLPFPLKLNGRIRPTTDGWSGLRHTPGLSSGRCLFYFMLQQNRVGDNCMRTPCLCPPPFLRSHGVYCPVHPSFIPEGIPLPPPPPRPCSCPTQGVVCRGRTVTCPVGSATQRLGEPLCASVCRMRMTRVSGPWGFCVGSTQITRYRERTSTQCLVGRKV